MKLFLDMKTIPVLFLPVIVACHALSYGQSLNSLPLPVETALVNLHRAQDTAKIAAARQLEAYAKQRSTPAKEAEQILTRVNELRASCVTPLLGRWTWKEPANKMSVPFVVLADGTTSRPDGWNCRWSFEDGTFVLRFPDGNSAKMPPVIGRTVEIDFKGAHVILTR